MLQVSLYTLGASRQRVLVEFRRCQGDGLIFKRMYRLVRRAVGHLVAADHRLAEMLVPEDMRGRLEKLSLRTRSADRQKSPESKEKLVEQAHVQAEATCAKENQRPIESSNSKENASKNVHAVVAEDGIEDDASIANGCGRRTSIG